MVNYFIFVAKLMPVLYFVYPVLCYQVALIFLICKNKSIYSDGIDECYAGINLIHTGFAVVSLILSTLFFILMGSFYVETNPYSDNS